MKAVSAKAKGIKLENRVASLIRELGLDKLAKKQPRSGAFTGFEGDIFTSLPLHFEAKNRETWQPLVYYAQATKDCPTGKTAVVVLSKNREDMYAFLSLRDLLNIVKIAQMTGLFTQQFGYSKTKQTQKKKIDYVDNDLPLSKAKQVGRKS